MKPAPLKIRIYGTSLFFIAVSLSLLIISYGPETHAAGSTYYVDIQNPSCNDNGVGSQTVPWCTLNKAVVTLTAGDTAYVAPGTYNIAVGPSTDTIGGTLLSAGERVIRPSNSGTSSQPIRLIAQSTASTIIGGGNAPAAQDDSHQVFVTGALIYIDQSYWQLEGLYVRDNGGIYSIRNSGFQLKDSLLFIEPRYNPPLLSAGGGESLQLYDSDNSVIDHVEMWSIMLTDASIICAETERNLLNVYDSSNIVLRNSLLYGGRNIHTFQNSDNFIIEYNQIFNAAVHIGGPGDNTHDWIYRYNIFSGYGQEAPYIVAHCPPYTNQNGQVYNNLNLRMAGSHIETYCPSQPAYTGMSNHLYRNNLVIQTERKQLCYWSWPPDINVVDSDYNMCVYQEEQDPWYTKKWWWITTEGSNWTLEDWRTQTEFPQLKQDPHSRHLGPDDGGDPGFITPLAQLGQREGGDVDCNPVFSGLCSASYISNCGAPYRMRLLDDFTITNPDSPLLGTGDPAYGNGNIGPFSYAGGENQAPVLAAIGPKTIHEQEALSFTVTATDPDASDTLTLSASDLPTGATFINNGDRTGTFNWTPTTSQADTYPDVHFEVTDGAETDFEDITITVLDGAPNCTPDWQCTDWSTCTDSLQTRTCTDTNECGTDAGKPDQAQACDSTAPGRIGDLLAR